MAIYPIDLSLQLMDDRLIDIFILQWHTPLPVHGHNWEQIQPPLAKVKLAILNDFHDWLLRYFLENTPPRPLFIVAPELSMPLCCDDLVNQIVNEMNRPTVMIAGLEYLQWDEYKDILANLPWMPQPVTWLTGGHENNIVNAAGIWIRDANGEIKKYIQPKLNPQDHENAIPLYRGQNTLFFCSTNKAHNLRLNFCVQICSDFSSAVFVQQLRQCIAAECAGVYLDLTFLIQCNADQEAVQFKQAVQTYFDVPNDNDMAPTQEGCLLFLNNANEKTGKSTKYGRSKLNFPFERWRYLEFPPPTYWVTDDGPHSHQAIILRESGPGIYWLTYKPHRLVRPIAGSRQSMPFPDTHARFAYIEETSFGQGTDADLFLPIPAVCHWLKGEWKEGGSELQSNLNDNNTNPDVVALFLGSYQSGVDSWCQVIEHKDYFARDTVNTYFAGWQKDKFPAKEAEPQRWSPDVSRAIKKMMRIYALLLLGNSAIPDGPISPKPNKVHHALADNGLQVTFLWGGDEFSPRHMLTTYQTIKDTFGVADILSKCLLILVNPAGTPDKETVLSDYKRDRHNIVQEPSTDAASRHLQKGDVVNVGEEEGLMLLYDGELIGEVDPAKNGNNLKQRLIARLNGAGIA